MAGLHSPCMLGFSNIVVASISVRKGLAEDLTIVHMSRAYIRFSYYSVAVPTHNETLGVQHKNPGKRTLQEKHLNPYTRASELPDSPLT